MFNWLIDKRVRVRMHLVTTVMSFHVHANDAEHRIFGALAYYEGNRKDRKTYLRDGGYTKELYNKANIERGGHAPTFDPDAMDENAYIEFDCWESTFRKIIKYNYGSLGLCHSPEIVKVL